MLALTFLGLGLLSASIDARNAQLYATSISDRIRSGDYADEVIESCEQEARQQGYAVDTQVYRSSDGCYKYGVLTLEYKYQVPILDVLEAKCITIDL